VVQVTTRGGTPAAGSGACGAAGADQVLERVAGVVAGFGVGVVAGAARDRDERGGEVGRGVPAGEAGVSGGGAVGVQRGEAPPGAGMARRGGSQIAGVVAVQRAEPAGLAGCFGAALVGGPGDREGNQRRDARPGARAWAGRRTATASSGPGAIVSASAFCANPAKVSCSGGRHT
jgi:hypothetical protein